MADYKNMYFFLFNRITDLIQELTTLQQEAEEMYLCQEEELISLSDLRQKNSSEK